MSLSIKKIYAEEINKTKILDLNWEDPQVYAEWLAQTFHYACYSTRIIGLAGCLFDYSRDDLHLKFLEHAKEEKNHEKVLIVDLKNLGLSLNQFEPSQSAKILFQNQYYWIQNVNPVSVYGYFLYLEGLAVEFGPQIYARIQKAHPENAVRYLKVHVEEDPGHLDGHYEFINKLSHTEQKQIEENLIQASFLYRSMLSEIVQLSAIKKSGGRKLFSEQAA
ncbi:MAG: iron-containing redox enzyme family protein [Pseudobdellovibrionaceae bacterium]